jgi:hypothetical protein
MVALEARRLRLTCFSRRNTLSISLHALLVAISTRVAHRAFRHLLHLLHRLNPLRRLLLHRHTHKQWKTQMQINDEKEWMNMGERNPREKRRRGA